MNQPSPVGTLNKTDYKQIAIKGVIVGMSAIIAYLIQVIPTLNFGHYQVFVTGILFMLGYIGQRLATGK